MDDALLVGVIQRLRHLHERLFKLFQGHRAHRAPDELRHAAPGQIAHGDIGDAIHLAVVVNRQDVWMFQVGDDIHFSLEPLQKAGVVEQVARQHLHCHNAIDRGLPGAVDSRHAAPPDLFQNLKLTQRFADQLILFRLARVFGHRILSGSGCFSCYLYASARAMASDD